MLYVAVSKTGVPQPYFMPSGLPINQNIYQNECSSKILILFIKYHGNGNYIFWPDKALAHYAKGTADFLISKNIPFMPKTEIQQAFLSADKLKIFKYFNEAKIIFQIEIIALKIANSTNTVKPVRLNTSIN